MKRIIANAIIAICANSHVPFKTATEYNVQVIEGSDINMAVKWGQIDIEYMDEYEPYGVEGSEKRIYIQTIVQGIPSSSWSTSEAGPFI